VIGGNGLERIIECELDSDERAAFDASVDHVKELVSQIKI
jgi:malate/lactate dehydrogenase